MKTRILKTMLIFETMVQIEYFEYLLTVIPEHMEDTDRSFLENLLPWSPKLSENIQK